MAALPLHYVVDIDSLLKLCLLMRFPYLPGSSAKFWTAFYFATWSDFALKNEKPGAFRKRQPGCPNRDLENTGIPNYAECRMRYWYFPSPLGPVAFRPRLATGLAFTLLVKKAKTRYEDSSVAGFPVPLKVGEVPEYQIPIILQFGCDWV